MTEVDNFCRYVSLPCRTERGLLEESTHIFDAYIYHPFLKLLGSEAIDVEMEDIINELYDTLMSLLHFYTEWMTGLVDLKGKLMQPVLERIRKSPEVVQEIAEAELVQAMAKASIGSSEAPGMQPADERTIQELNLSTSRQKVRFLRRVRSRYRREHTV
jgi:hypothetical protein